MSPYVRCVFAYSCTGELMSAFTVNRKWYTQHRQEVKTVLESGLVRLNKILCSVGIWMVSQVTDMCFYNLF